MKEPIRSVESLKKALLNKDTSIINEFKEYYTIKTEKVEDEEGSNIFWEKYQFIKDGEVLFKAETSWEKENIIQRITIYDSLIKYSGNIFIGQSFGNFKKKIRYAYLDESFGTFYVKIAKKDNVSIELKVEQNDNPVKWETDLSKIPDDRIVESLIINIR